MSPPSARPSDPGELAASPRAAPAGALSQYVLKIVSRCDLSCDHCYVYEHPDQTWRRQPRTMSPETVAAAAGRIAEHAVAHRLDAVRVVLHGGEPLLAGAAGLAGVAAELRRQLDPVTRLDLRMQSNGVLLTEEIAEVLVDHGVAVGISLDGDRAANDRHRRYANGASSHTQVLRALALLRRPEYRPAYAGLLCTVDLANDPVRVYRALLAEDPPHIDFLLPHANWERPPPRPPGVPTPYAHWLLAVHRQWTADGRPVPIRLLDSLLATATGGVSGTEAVGLAAADLAVIETDGSYEQVDSLKSAFDGAPATGLDVLTHPIDEVAAHPMIAVRQAGLAGLCATCRSCPVVRQCGGGLFAHRYRPGHGFDNPSVYCTDLVRLISAMSAGDDAGDRPVTRPATIPAPRRPPADGPPEPSGPSGGPPEPGRAAAASPRPGPSRATAPPEPGRPAAASPRPGDSLAPAILDDLGSGYGGDDAVGQLAAIHLAKTRALLVALSPAAATSSVAAAGWDLLVDLDVTAPDAVREVLAHPFVRRWAHRCHDRPALADLGRLAAVAAAAAIRAGATADLAVPVRDGVLDLPTVGALVVPDADRPAAVSVSAGGVRVRAGDTDVTVRPGDTAVTARPDGAGHPAGWRPVRRVPGRAPVLIEDTDPYRDCYQDLPVAPRLSGPDAARWQRHLDAAIRRIDAEAGEYAPGVGAVLRAVVPLRPDRGGRQRSAAAATAFGAVAVTPAPDDAALAVLLVHEVQHLKLDGVLDVCDLVDRGDPRRVRVPWREDPRPVEGVLHGTYAHLAVADVWRRRPGAAAGAHHRRYRDWTAGALDTLLDLGALTPAGERFARRMRATVDTW
ncbi:FxsB family cyclophane-forming radical SAM/SPASM peptide maturase [Micromonospora costi]|uniref:FxsB family radical SAM/SPASM domain protein n=1 Tax=Micromonospora costi TaxID=1530042 RepID=A0A3A9ZPT3_9ACTN|nr:FxsB family cyclophane-forming radical SAM/SPASM peptide maturase [Micromonospora costi]RKN50205.1 FxsB family radical SAM/SPASM domain protein [Micromonospora costi]